MDIGGYDDDKSTIGPDSMNCPQPASVTPDHPLVNVCPTVLFTILGYTLHTKHGWMYCLYWPDRDARRGSRYHHMVNETSWVTKQHLRTIANGSYITFEKRRFPPVYPSTSIPHGDVYVVKWTHSRQYVGQNRAFRALSQTDQDMSDYVTVRYDMKYDRRINPLGLSSL
jgi:hypothetical protein